MLNKCFQVALAASRFNCYENPMLTREVCGGDFATSVKRGRWGFDYGFADQTTLLLRPQTSRSVPAQALDPDGSHL